MASLDKLLPKNSSVLILQMPIGPFSRKLRKKLISRGNDVAKVNFNGGDLLDSLPYSSINYMGSPGGWPYFFKEIVKRLNVEHIYVFGDCRYYHKEAIAICPELGVTPWVFEEGYIRPKYITLEKWGVNANSRMFSREKTDQNFYVPDAVKCKPHFNRQILNAVAYYLLMTLCIPFFRHYIHHRATNIFSEAFCWSRSLYRKVVNRRRDRKITENIVNGESEEMFYMGVLQLDVDSQIKYHSKYKNMVEFMEETIKSFSEHAPSSTKLVFKQHPLSRGHIDYRNIVRYLANSYNVAGRVEVFCDGHLPTLLKNALGVVTINSTVGISSIYHGAPTICMGKRTFYDLPGLTNQCSLDDFWANPIEPDEDTCKRFRSTIINETQINGNFYGSVPGLS